MNTFRARRNGSNQALTKGILSVAALGTASISYWPGLSDRIFAAGGTCEFQQLFHWKCPFCGMTHAVVALLHGNFTSVFRLNPFAIIYLTGLIAMLAWLFSENAKAVIERIDAKAARVASICIFIGFLSYSIGRNVLA